MMLISLLDKDDNRVLILELISKKKVMKSLSYTLLTVLTVDLLASSGDITMTWTSPVLPKLYSNESDVNPFGRPITSDEESWIASLINIGAMIGPFPYGFLAEKFGRKITLLCIAIPHIISYLTFAFSKTVYLYYFARLLGGIAVGGGYTLLPMYVAEVAEDCNRGRLSLTLNIFWILGSLIPYMIGPYISILWFNIILACVPTTFFILFFLIAPETPYYLMVNNKIEEAEKSLMVLRSNDKKVVEVEMRHIQSQINKNEEKVSLFDFFRSKINMKALLICFVLIIAQQLSGINAVLFYTQEIFQAAGVTGIKPEEAPIIIGAVILPLNFGTPFIVDKLGRKILIFTSLVGCTIFLLLLGAFFYLKTSTSVDVSDISWLPLLSLLLYSIMFNIGLGPLPWTVSSELFPTNVKPYAASLVSCACWTTSFFVTKFFTDLQESIGRGETFWLFGGFCAVAAVFTVYFVPETKGKSFQEIQKILEDKTFFTKFH